MTLPAVCREAVQEYAEDLALPSGTKQSTAGKKALSNKKNTPGDLGYCIGCGDAEHSFNTDKPLCMKCYRKSKKATDLELLGKRKQSKIGSVYHCQQEGVQKN